MTLEIGLVLGILLTALVLLAWEKLRADVVALLVLSVLTLMQLVTPLEAVAGFSNPAVITVWAMFMLSAGLSRTGVANIIGDRVLHLAGEGRVRLVLVIMLTSGFLSAFMNNIGVAALLLPVVMDIGHRTRTPPSQLLMPLAYGCLLGGLTTLVGTPPNILVSQALLDAGLTPFQLFDFTPVGLIAALGGTILVVFLGGRVLPAGRVESVADDSRSLAEMYELDERSVVMRLPQDSELAGCSLATTRLGSAAGLNVFAVFREGKLQSSPDPGTILQGGDRLLVGGSLGRLEDLRGWRGLILEESHTGVERLVSGGIGLQEVVLGPGSSLVGETLRRVDFRRRFGLIVLALRRDGFLAHFELADTPLLAGDHLLLLCQMEALTSLAPSHGLSLVDSADPAGAFDLAAHLFAVRIPPGSTLGGRSLAESRLGHAFRLGVLGILRGGRVVLLPAAEEKLETGDLLLIRGDQEDLRLLRGLQGLEVEDQSAGALDRLESERIGLLEVMLAPRSTLAGRTLRDLGFREKYGLQVLAIQRGGHSHRSNLRDLQLQFGDALLLLGPRDRMKLLAREPDFLVLTQAIQERSRTEKAPLAAVTMVGVMVAVLAGWLPISIAAVSGATLMVLLRCLTMDEAYRAVEWRAIFLIAGMLPLGTAMQHSGATAFLAQGVLDSLGQLGPWGIVLGLYGVTAVATMIIPTAALVVLMAPIALQAAADTGLSPYALMMAVAMAASASFTSPIAHPANLLVMGPAGYRFSDYIKLGVPLTLVVLVLVLLVLPLFWPLQA